MSQDQFRQLTFSPLRAIREQCLWCCAQQVTEIIACTAERCPLYSVRHGIVHQTAQDLLRLIRKKCLDCTTGSWTAVEKCASRHCPLWNFRQWSQPRSKGCRANPV